MMYKVSVMGWRGGTRPQRKIVLRYECADSELHVLPEWVRAAVCLVDACDSYDDIPHVKTLDGVGSVTPSIVGMLYTVDESFEDKYKRMMK